MLGFLGRFSWFFDLFSHFRIQYAFVLVVLGLTVLAGRRRKVAATFVGFAAINILPVLPMFFGGHPILTTSGLPIRAVLINVNSRLGDPDQVSAFIRDVDPDLLVIEEFSSRWRTFADQLDTSHPYRLIIPREDNFGIALFSRLRTSRLELVELGDAELPSIIAVLRTPASPLRIIATHPPPPLGPDYSRWRNRHLAAIPRHTPPGDPLILLGDLNVTPWNGHFRRLMRDSGLQDSAQGFGVQPSWPDFAWIWRIPLDHCLYSAGITIVDRRIGPDVGSDHRPLIVDFLID